MNWRRAIGAESPQNASRDSGEVASASRTLAFWTLVSRFTGFARVAAIAAVFGATFFGNLFQAALLVPYLLCELLAGSLIASLLPPHLVHARERDGEASLGRLARGFLGVILPLFAGVALIVAALSPFVVSLLSAAAPDDHVREMQTAIGVPLLLCLLPQMVFYAISSVGISVQHAHRRFAFSTAAQVIENLGVILVLGVSAAIYGIGMDVDDVSTGQIVLLGLGTTAAVAAQAAAQWWGAWRVGVKLFPTAGWRIPEVRAIVRTAIPSCGAAALNSLGLLALMIACNVIPGGVIAMQIGMNFYNLPIALSAFPIAFAQSPLLSRHFARADLERFAAIHRDSLRLTLFFAFPATAVFLGMPLAIAAGISFGEMSDASALSLVAAVLAGLGFGIVGEAIFVVARSSAYARLDALDTLRAMLVRVVIILVGIPLAMQAGSVEAQLLDLGFAWSIAALAAGGFLTWRVNRAVPHIDRAAIRWVAVNVLTTAIATAPAIALAWSFDFETGSFGERIGGALALLSLSGALYLLLQYLRRSEELGLLLGLTRLRLPAAPKTAPPAA